MRELVAFARLLAERLEPPLPVEAARGKNVAALWMGTHVGSPFEEPTTDAASGAVERDWPSLRSDIREHPLFAELKGGLGGDHDVFSALDRVQGSYERYSAASGEGWAFVHSALLHEGLFDEEACRSLADVLLLDAFHHATTSGGIEFGLEAQAVEEGENAAGVWTLRLGAAFIRRRTSQEIDGVRSRWPALVGDARDAGAIKRVAETWEATERDIQVFRAAMPTRRALREILVRSDSK